MAQKVHDYFLSCVKRLKKNLEKVAKFSHLFKIAGLCHNSYSHS